MNERVFSSKHLTLLVALVLISSIGIPFASAGEPSKVDIAESLAYSGCTYGLRSDPVEFGMSQVVSTVIEIRLNFKIIEDGSAPTALTKIDVPSIRLVDQHVQQAWATAGLLNSRWNGLSVNLNNAMKVGLTKWKSGSTYGVSGKAAVAASGPVLTGLCRVAQINVTAKAKKSRMSIKKYVVKTAGPYFPPLPK